MSSKEIKIESFLGDYTCQFQGTFTIINPRFDEGSEINPIKLAIPKSIQGKSGTSTTPQNITKISPPRSKGRILTKLPFKANPNQNSPAPTVLPNDKPKEPQNIPTNEICENNQNNSDLIDSMELHLEQYIKSSDIYWLYPVSRKGSSTFYVTVAKSPVSLHFELFYSMQKPPIMQATVNGTTFHDPITFSIQSSPDSSLSTYYDKSNNLFYATADNYNSKKIELCCSQIQAPHIFTLLIPVLKKNRMTGKSFLVPIPFTEDQCNLFEKSKTSEHESLAFESRAKTLNDDFSYQGRFMTNEKTNFILYHYSNPTTNILQFGKTDRNGAISLIINFPISPIQAFFAAITTYLQ